MVSVLKQLKSLVSHLLRGGVILSAHYIFYSQESIKLIGYRIPVFGGNVRWVREAMLIFLFAME
jgi:hypothetical protein